MPPIFRKGRYVQIDNEVYKIKSTSLKIVNGADVYPDCIFNFPVRLIEIESIVLIDDVEGLVISKNPTYKQNSIIESTKHWIHYEGKNYIPLTHEVKFAEKEYVKVLQRAQR